MPLSGQDTQQLHCAQASVCRVSESVRRVSGQCRQQRHRVQILNSHALVADEDALVAGEYAIVAEQDAVVAWGMITEQCTQQCRCLCIDSQKSTA